MKSNSQLPSDVLLKQIQRTPKFAMPTILLGTALMAGTVATWYFALQGILPLWVGCLINGVLAYGMFSVAHDGSHRATPAFPG